MMHSHDNEQLPLQQFTENAYLNYAMYVIMDRALPFIGDGLKPVQRRIIYAMSELGLTAGAKFKKSARTVGDVLGKYHPHGDTACYEAMVLMAQSFSYRYPLIEGQGNWGAPDDPKSFAAMRYTESRLSTFSSTFLSELTLETVDTQPNFDGTLQEPKWLPARLPHILLNGTTGIAVGMATDIPPHNLREIVQAAILLIDDPNADLSAVMAHIQGPDYPTSAEIITSRSDLAALYQSGKGTLKMRALWQQQGHTIIISALPYQVSGAKVLEQIAGQIRSKTLPMVDDLRDESNHENPVRLIIILRAACSDPEALIHHLFATTDLEKSYRVNLNILGLDGLPAVKSLITILQEWLDFRRTAVRRRLHYRLEKVHDRLHLLAGLLIAFVNLEHIITIIRNEDEPAAALRQHFNLTSRQIEAILELKLRHLAKLEGAKMSAEQHALEQECLKLEGLLCSESQLNQLIKRELRADAQQYGDQRRSPLTTRSEAKALSTQDVQNAEPVTLVLSQQGWIRCIKGHESDPTQLNYRAGDNYRAHLRANSHQAVLLFDSSGRSYTLDAHALPPTRGQGEPLSTQFTLPPSATLQYMVTAERKHALLLASDAGYGFICCYADVLSCKRAGKAILHLPAQAQMLPPLSLTHNKESDALLAITTDGRLLIFPVNTLAQLSKGKGNKIIAIPATAAAQREQLLIHLALVPCTTRSITLFAGKRKMVLKAADLASFYGARGSKGTLLPRGLQRVHQVIINANECPGY